MDARLESAATAHGIGWTEMAQATLFYSAGLNQVLAVPLDNTVAGIEKVVN